MRKAYGIKYPVRYINGYYKALVYSYWRRIFWNQHNRPYVILNGVRFYIN